MAYRGNGRVTPFILNLGQLHAPAALLLEKETLLSSEQEARRDILEKRKIGCPYEETNQVTTVRV
jgi:hypothetical protein